MRIIAFELAESLDPNGSAIAHRLIYNASTDTYEVDTANQLTVTNYSGTEQGAASDNAKFSGVAGYRGTAAQVLNSHDEKYELLWLEHIAHNIQGELTSDMGSTVAGEASASVEHFSDGREPPTPTITVRDPKGLFPKALEGAKFKAVWDDNEELDTPDPEFPPGSYVLVECDQLSPLQMTLASGCDGTIPVGDFSAIQHPPLSQQGDAETVDNPFNLGTQTEQDWLVVWDHPNQKWVAIQAYHEEIEVASDLNLELDGTDLKLTWKEHKIRAMRCAEPVDKDAVIPLEEAEVIRELRLDSQETYGETECWLQERAVTLLVFKEDIDEDWNNIIQFQFREVVGHFEEPEITESGKLKVVWRIDQVAVPCFEEGEEENVELGDLTAVMEELEYSDCALRGTRREVSVLKRMDPVANTVVPLTTHKVAVGISLNDEYDECHIQLLTRELCLFDGITPPDENAEDRILFQSQEVLVDAGTTSTDLVFPAKEVWVPCVEDADAKVIEGTECPENDNGYE